LAKSYVSGSGASPGEHPLHVGAWRELDRDDAQPSLAVLRTRSTAGGG
jgi:hypothetical protein